MGFEIKQKHREEEIKDDANEQERKLVDYWYFKFKEAIVAKSEYTKKWYVFKDAYNGDYFTKEIRPSYKSNQVSNFIFSLIETIRPIMTDNNPEFIALPKKDSGADKAELVQMALNSEWDRENMSSKLPKNLLPALQFGTAIFGLFWDGKDDGGIGNVKCKLINPFNFFPDPMATSVDDAEYIIYATYKHVNKLKKAYPEKANLLDGGSIKYEELATSGMDKSSVRNQVLVLEIWCRDYTTVEVEEEKENGEKIKKRKMKYPRGRVITCCPELGVLLSDKPNPYKDGKFPFILLKDYDIPFEFWGKGEIEQLLSPQKYINELNNQIIDNAKLTANQVWVIDKNAGIGTGKLTNRPGLVVRKNPGSEVKREAPPPMPSYVGDMIEKLKMDMETICGVHDVTQGRRAVGVVAAQAIMALQEAGQARIRLKVRLMESALSNLANMWYNRLQQFWLFERWVRVVDSNGEYDFRAVTPEDLKEDMDIVISAGSTMPKNKNAMLDLMVRLSQTPAEDGLPMVDRKTVLQFVPVNDKKAIINRFEEMKQLRQNLQTLSEENAMLKQELMQLQDSLNEQPGGAEDKQIPIELLDRINNLSESEMKELLTIVPNLEQILETASNPA